MQPKFLNTFFIAIMLCIFAAGYVTYLQMDKLLVAHGWVTHTYKVIEENESVLAEILEIESNIRGYLVSNDEDFINDFEEKRTEIFINFNKLAQMAKDNPSQLAPLKELKDLLDKRLQTLSASIILKKTGDMQSPAAMELIASGQQLTAQIKAVNLQIYDTEVTLLDTREKQTIKNFNNTIYFTALVTILCIVFLIAILIVFNSLIAKSKVTNEELNKTFTMLQNHSNEMTLVNNMNNFLTSSYSLNETMQILSNYLKKILPQSSGILFLMKASANYLENFCHWGEPILAENIFAPTQCWALRQGAIYSYFDANNSIACQHSSSLPTPPPYICMPLLAQNEIIGLLYIEIDTVEKSQINILKVLDQYKRIIQSISGQIAMSVSNIRLHEVLKTRSTRDPLTNLYNRAYLLDTLARDIERAKVQNIPIGIAMMDLDHFKEINDRYGHAMGDQVLQKVSGVLTENLAQGDIVCRYGGEEFLLVLYDSDVVSSMKRFEELREKISHLQFASDQGTFYVTASFGVAMYPSQFAQGEDAVMDLIKASDSALYQSKNAGRNCVTLFGDRK